MKGRHLYPLAWVAMVLLLFACSANAQTIGGLISEWKADGNTLDSVGSNNASIAGNVTYTPGKFGSAFNFDGSLSYLTLTDAPSLRPEQLTIEAWIKPNFVGRGSDGDVDTIFERYDGGFLFFVIQDAGRVFGGSPVGHPQGAVGLQITINGTFFAAYSSNVVPQDGQYHHVAATFDGYTVRVYVDGVVGATNIVATSGPPGVITYAPGLPVYMGIATPPVRPTKAAIDDIKLFGRGLSSGEVAADASKPPVPGGIVVTGHDPDYHAFAGGFDGPAARRLFRALVSYVSSGLPNPRILLITDLKDPNPDGERSDPRLGLEASGFGVFDVAVSDIGDATGVQPHPVVDLATVNFKSYDVVIVASAFAGWLHQAEVDALTARRNDLYGFVNGGGGLVALAESSFDGQDINGPFGFLPFVSSQGQPEQEVNNTITPFGLSIGVTLDEINGNFSHSFFNTQPVGMGVVDNDVSGHILTLAVRGKPVSDAGVGGPGGIFVTGHDPDFHAVAGLNALGAQHTFQDAIAYVTNGRQNPRILLVTDLRNPGGTEIDSRLGLEASGFGAFDVAVADVGDATGSETHTVLDVNTVDFKAYDVVIVASDFGGWLHQDELDVLNARRNDIIAFVNLGGGLVALGESGTNLTTSHDRFGFLPFLASNASHNENETTLVLTPFGQSLGLTNADINGNFSHNTFTTTGGMAIVDTDGDGNIISLAERGQILSGGGFGQAGKPVITGGLPMDGAGNILIGGIYGPLPGAPVTPGKVTRTITGTGVPGATITIIVKDPLHPNSGDNFVRDPIIVGENGSWSGNLTLFDCDPEVDITQTVGGGGPSDPVIWSGPVDGTPPKFLFGGPTDGTDLVGGDGMAQILLSGGATDTGSFVPGDAVGYEWRLYDGADYGSYTVVGNGGDTLDYFIGPGDYYFELAATDSAGNVLIGKCHHTVKKNQCSVSVDAASIYWNETGALTGKVLDGMGNAIPGAALHFTVNGADAGDGTNYHATADAGGYTITGAFGGNAQYDPATGTGSLSILLRPTSIAGTDIVAAQGATITLPGALGDVRLGGMPAPGTLTWKVNGQPAANPYTVGLAPGVYPIDVDFPGDKHYAPSHATFKLTVPTPPSIINCGVGTDSLWPPNHDLVNVNLNYTVVPGTYPIAKTTVIVYSNEPDLGPDGDDQFSPDAKGSSPGALRLRSERGGQSAGRVYLVVITAVDTMGNTAVCCHATVTVPHDQSKASKDQVAGMAATAAAYAEAHNGTPPTGYVKVGDGPVIGPKQ